VFQWSDLPVRCAYQKEAGKNQRSLFQFSKSSSKAHLCLLTNIFRVNLHVGLDVGTPLLNCAVAMVCRQ
jgi:hypothetical protein